MSRSVTTLSARLTATDNGFSATLARARASLASIQQGVGDIRSAIAGPLSLLGGAGLTGGIYAMTAALRDGLQKAGSVRDLSNTLGESAANVMQVQHALRLAGGQVNELEGAIQRLNVSVAGALAGEKGPTALFQRLGIDAARFASANLPSQMRQLASALRSLPPAQQLDALVQLVGRGNAMPFQRMLGGGAEALDAQFNLARQDGFTLSEAQADAADRAGDALDRLTLAADALKMQLSTSFAPTIERLVQTIIKTLPKGNDARLLGEGIAQYVSNPFAAMRLFGSTATDIASLLARRELMRVEGGIRQSVITPFARFQAGMRGMGYSLNMPGVSRNLARNQQALQDMNLLSINANAIRPMQALTEFFSPGAARISEQDRDAEEAARRRQQQRFLDDQRSALRAFEDGLTEAMIKSAEAQQRAAEAAAKDLQREYDRLAASPIRVDPVTAAGLPDLIQAGGQAALGARMRAADQGIRDAADRALEAQRANTAAQERANELARLQARINEQLARAAEVIANLPALRNAQTAWIIDGL